MSMKTPCLTVITPVYNGKRFIECCLLSVIHQNCLGVEHWVIDGGSSDGTLDIIRRYAGKYPHIRWVSEKDGGQSAALNKGIALAQGDVIGILNYDDYYEPAVLPRVLKIFEAAPDLSFVVGNCNVLNDDEKIIYLNRPYRLSLVNMLIGGQENQFPYNPSAYFYHKSLHKKVGPYDESDHQTMDIDFLLKVLPVSHVRYVDETWGNFRYIQNSKTFRSKENNELERHKKRLTDLHLKKLPWPKQWWITAMRYVFVEKKPHYYAGRIMECFKSPQELSEIVLRKLERHGVYRKPSKLVWEACAPCPVKRVESSIAQISHELFVFGGYHDLDQVLNDIDVLDFKKKAWTSCIKMPPRMPQTHKGITHDGQRYIYCVAGQLGPQCHPCVPDCFVLDAQEKTWGQLPPLPEGRYAPTVQLWHGRLHALGGTKEDRNTPACEHWSIAVSQGKALENEWRKEIPIPKGGPHRASAIIKDRFYVFGGQGGDLKPIVGDPACKCDWTTPAEIVYGDTFALKAGADRWQKMAAMPLPATHSEAPVLINDRFAVLVGGHRSRWILSDAIQVYDADTNNWRVADRLPFHIKTSAAYYDGWLYLVAGQYSKSRDDLRPGEVHDRVWRAKFSP
jgi:glycosyltransferase involved in cell wall biosynthesis